MKCLQSADFIEAVASASSIKFVRGVDVGSVELLLNNPSVDSLLNYDQATGGVFWKPKKEDMAPAPSTGSGLLLSSLGVYSFYSSPGFVYIDSTGVVTPLADGTDGQVLVMYNGSPTWSSGSSTYLDITADDGLKVLGTLSPSTVTISGRKLTLTNDIGGISTARNFTVSCKPAVSTALGGIDTVTQSPGNWYYVYVISDGDNLNAIMSLNRDKPLMPTGYTYFRRVSATYLRSTSVIDYYVQRGNFVKTDGAYFNGPIAIPSAFTFIPGTTKTIPSQIPPIAFAASLEVKISARTGTASIELRIQGYQTPIWIIKGVPPQTGGGVYSIIYDDIPIDGDNANISWWAGTTDITQASCAMVGYKIHL